MARFEFLTTPIQDLIVVQRSRIGDARGFLSRFFCAEEFARIGYDKPIQQINHTLTSKIGTVRGMHYQKPPYAEIKMVSCLKGKIFDIAVDLRKNSPTFLQWYGEVLSEDNQRSLVIPEGFAHGFQTLTTDCELVYLHTATYVQGAEAAVNALDPMIAIDWPLPISERSVRDEEHPLLTSTFEGMTV